MELVKIPRADIEKTFLRNNWTSNLCAFSRLLKADLEAYLSINIIYFQASIKKSTNMYKLL